MFSLTKRLLDKNRPIIKKNASSSGGGLLTLRSMEGKHKDNLAKLRVAAMEQRKAVEESLKEIQKERDLESEAKTRLLREKKFVSDLGVGDMNGQVYVSNVHSKGTRVTVPILAKELGWSIDETRQKIMEVEGLRAPPDVEKGLSEELVQFMLLEYGPVEEGSLITSKFDVQRRPQPESMAENVIMRPPIITIMGHVDHGKTTLLDFFRKSNIVAGEAGGITQHIGAFSVHLRNGQKVTFLDTPGHEAFCDMRHRGAMVTDLVILVVAAPDAIQNQTIESIKYATEAKVPIIVAITKFDIYKSGMKDIESELTTYGIVSEAMGGETQCIKVSAATGLNMEALEEAIAAECSVLNLKSYANGPMEGIIIESRRDKYKGFVATVLVQNSILRPGDLLVCGTTGCKVRTMTDSNGNSLAEAGPSMPVEVSGWEDIPHVASDVLQVSSLDEMKNVTEERKMLETLKLLEIQKQTEIRSAMAMRNRESPEYKEHMARLGRVYVGDGSHYVHINDLKPFIMEENSEERDFTVRISLNVDVVGTLEALCQAISKLPMRKVRVDIVEKRVGPLSTADVELAEMFKGPALCFNVPIVQEVANCARRKNVEICSFKVIYHLVAKIEELMLEKLPKLFEEKVVGVARVKAKFVIDVPMDILTGKVDPIADENNKSSNVANSKKGTKKKYREKAIAGCAVNVGFFEIPANNAKKYQVRVIRDGEQINKEDSLLMLKHFKDSVRKIDAGSDCGIMLKSDFADFQEGDSIELVELVERKSCFQDLY